MRTWQVERRKRTRHLIELGGLVTKAGIVDLTGDDRTVIYGALLWMADKLKSEDGERARDVWTGLGKTAFENERSGRNLIAMQNRHAAIFGVSAPPAIARRSRANAVCPRHNFSTVI